MYRSTAYDDVTQSCCYVWYIEGVKQNILVDAGDSAESIRNRGHIEEHIQSIDEGLAKLELTPESIDIVILTHLHTDHVSLAHRYTKAKFIVHYGGYSMTLKNIGGSVSPHILYARKSLAAM